jgi:hypothetical protein
MMKIYFTMQKTVVDCIVDDIKDGVILFVDEEIADECGLGSDEGNDWHLARAI